MSEHKRSLNLFDTVMLVSGSMIGSGIFIVSADMMRALGSPFWVLMCWVISGVITLLAALCYGELAGMMPHAGGQFIYLKRAYGKVTSFIYGWAVFTVIQTGVIAAVAVAFARYVGVLIPVFDEKNYIFSLGSFHISTSQVLAVVSVFFLSWLNAKGIHNGKIIQRIFTSAKISALIGLILIGVILGFGSGYWNENISISFSPIGENYKGMTLLSALGVAMIGSLFSSDAWNNVTFIAGEIKNPQKNIPLGLLFGVLIVTVLYLLANVAYFILLPAAGIPDSQNEVLKNGIAFAQNDRVGSAALFPVFGNISSVIMAVLIIISTFGCNNGLILSGARLFNSMATEGMFFISAAHLNEKHVPSKALWMQATWASVLCISGSYGSLLDYCTFASLLFYVVTIFALFILRKKEPDAERHYKTLAYPFLPALYIFITGFICINLIIQKPANTLIGIGIILLGLPVYFFFSRKNA